MDKKSIDNIVWYIPIRKLRDAVRDFLTSFYTIEKSVNTFMPVKSLRNIEIQISEHCNMACYSCSHFSQLAKEEFRDINILENDLKRLSEITNGLVDVFRITGGEPLLNPRCTEYYSIINKYFPDSIIYLNTNGILLLKQNEKFWEECKKYKVIIIVSGYPLNLDIEKIKEKCKSYDIHFDIYIEKEQEKKISYKTLLNINSTMDPSENFYNCGARNGNCIHLYNGKIYPCAIVSNIRHFNSFFNTNYPVSTLDYIDIHKTTAAEIGYFLSRPVPFCKYCIQPPKIASYWKPSKKDIHEYID